MSCVTWEPKSTMRILSWCSIGASRGVASDCRALAARIGPVMSCSAPQKADKKAVGVGPARRHQQAFVRDERRPSKHIGTLAQHACHVDGLFHGKIPMIS